MPSDRSKSQTLMGSLQRLSKEGQSWFAAEATLARAELADGGKRVTLILILCMLALGSLFSATILLSLFLVALLAPHVNGLANAAGILGLALILFAAASAGYVVYSFREGLANLRLVLDRWLHMADKRPEGTP